MLKITNNSWKITKPHGHIYFVAERRTRYSHYIHWRGTFNLKEGTVIIHSQYKTTDLQLTYKGVVYSRQIEGRSYTPIGLKRVAGKFAREIINKLS